MLISYWYILIEHLDALMANKIRPCLVYYLYLWDSEDTTTTRAGAERRSTSCRHWTSRKWPKWQIWKVDSRPSSVKLQGCVQTPALHTRMCSGLWGRREAENKHVLFFIDYKRKQRGDSSKKGNFHTRVGWRGGKERWKADTEKGGWNSEKWGQK